MLRIKKITFSCVEYNNRNFPAINAEAHIDNDKEESVITLASEILQSFLFQNEKPKSENAESVDSEIYAYIPAELFEKTEKDIIDFIESNID